MNWNPMSICYEPLFLKWEANYLVYSAFFVCQYGMIAIELSVKIFIAP